MKQKAQARLCALTSIFAKSGGKFAAVFGGRDFLDSLTSKLGASLASTLPMGSSLMRVIPIESSIDGDPQAVDFEKISYYLDKYDVFSVSDCSCRASRRIMG